MPAPNSAIDPTLGPIPAPAATVSRWTGALLIVLVLHAAAAWLLLTRATPPISQPAAPEAVMLDLAPDLPAIQPATLAPPPEPTPTPAPASPPDPAPAPPPEPTPEPTPEPLPVLPPTPPEAAEIELPSPPPRPRVQPTPQPIPRPKPKPPERRVERQPPPPAEAAERPIQPSAPTPETRAPAQAAARPPALVSIPLSWRGELVARLQRAKRYPDLARSRGDRGVATISFTMDRAGRVLAVTLVQSSGSALLDEEAAALVRRAEPLPRLPDDFTGTTLTLAVPISFALR